MTATSKNRRSPATILNKAVVYSLLVVGAIIMLLPFYYMVTTATKTADETFTAELVWVPRNWKITEYISAWKADRQNASLGLPVTGELKKLFSTLWVNFADAWKEDRNFPWYYMNSLIIAVTTTVLQLATSALAAYAFATMKFKGKEIVFMIFLGTMMIPGQVTLVPNYVIVAKLGWIDTYKALIIPWIASVFSIFMMRQFFMTIPAELWDAAQIDGCTRFEYLWRVMLPLAVPVLVTTGLFSFISGWNTFLWPLIVTNSPRLRTIQVGLSSFNQEFGTKPNLLMAASTTAIAPLLVLFFIAQKQFIQGIARTGLKS